MVNIRGFDSRAPSSILGSASIFYFCFLFCFVLLHCGVGVAAPFLALTKCHFFLVHCATGDFGWRGLRK